MKHKGEGETTVPCLAAPLTDHPKRCLRGVLEVKPSLGLTRTCERMVCTVKKMLEALGRFWCQSPVAFLTLELS
jgi:hypothetical protein